MNVLVYNADGINPYAAEVSALLAGRGADVELLDTSNGEHRPVPQVRWRRRLPANFGDVSPVRQAIGLAVGLVRATWASLVEGRVLIVAFSRFPLESAVFALLALVGRPVVVVLHNPVARRAESLATRLARRALLARAASIVIHAERLRADVEYGRDRLVVCPHPPYHTTARPVPATAAGDGAGRRWVAFIGTLRWDKGVDLLPAVFELVPEEERRRLGVVVCGRGSVPEGMWDRLAELGYATRDLTSDGPIPQQELLEVLAGQPLVLAPYVAATQSGTVILALTMGCRVVAFDEGGIPDVIDRDGLVPTGDLGAMAAAVAEDRGGRGLLAMDEWVEQAAERWWRAATAATGPRRRASSPRRRAVVRALVRRAAPRTPLAPRALVRLDRRWRTGRAARFEQVVDDVIAQRPDVVSLDLFDTVLTRRVIAAEDVWWIVGARLAQAGGSSGVAAAAVSSAAERFVVARRQAARDLPHAPLHELAEHPALAAFGPHVAACESELEASLIRPVPGVAEALGRLRAAGTRLVFVTDMHLRREDLTAALRVGGLMTDDDELVISSELGVSKARGALFAALKPDSRRVVHVGNDLWSDVAMAEAAGVSGIAITAAEPNRAEASMASRNGSAGTAIAAAARMARLRRSAVTPEDAALVETGTLAGQAFTAFLLWAREQCAAEGITDLGFLARDGALPLRMAQAMPSDHWEGFRLRYVAFASRRAWTIAAAASVGIDAWLAVGDADERAFIHTSRHLVPFRSLLGRIALGTDDLDGHPRLQRLDPDRPLPAGLASDWSAVLADPAIRATILQRAEEARELLADHLDELGLGAGRLALVDVGWRGQLAWMKSAVLRDLTGSEPIHLHFGGANVARALDRVDIRRFAVDDSVAPLPFPDMVSCVETFTASGEERSVGLRRTPSGEVQVVHAPGAPAVANRARERLWEAAIGTAACLPTRTELASWGLDGTSLAGEVRELLTGFWTEPEPAHAIAAAQLAFEVDEIGTVVGPVATGYRLREFLGDRGPSPRQWRQGSLLLTPAPLRTGVRLLLRVKDRLGR